VLLKKLCSTFRALTIATPKISRTVPKNSYFR